MSDIVVGAAGRGFTLELDGEPVGQITTRVRDGQRLQLKATGEGVRGYLALAGGIETGDFLGSASVDRYGLIGRALRAGDVLGRARDDTAPHEMQARAQEIPYHLVIRLHRGPQWSQEAENAPDERALHGHDRRSHGRPARRARGPGGELLSESPPPGAVQVPGSGAPILLLADRQRSAGYDKPAVIHPDDLSLAGQLRPGETIRFVIVGDHPVPWFRDLD